MNDESDDRLKKELDEAKERIRNLERPSINDYKSVGIALVLSIVLGLVGIMGIGHFYGGRYRRGFVILVSGLLMMFFAVGGFLLPLMGGASTPLQIEFNLLIFSAPLLVLYGWQVFDSRKTVLWHNELVDKHYRERK